MVEFPFFDADNHYYEATDAFTRHLDPKMGGRAMQWATVNGKQRLLVGGTINRFIPNPTFANVSRPGALVDYFRAKVAVTDMREAFGALEPITDRPEYRNRDARLRVMDGQGMEATIMLPTLGVGMEQALQTDPEACHAAFSSFNRWLDEDWGFNHQDRLYAAPYIPLIAIDAAVTELDYVLSHGARVVLMRPASVYGAAGYRTPGDKSHDAFWARLNEAGVTLVFHGGDSGYRAYEANWGMSGETEAFRSPVLKRLLSASPIRDTIASLMSDQLFDRFPNLRVATIETGADWVRPLLKKLRSSAVQAPHAWKGHPVELFQQHVWVSPFFEDDVHDLIGLVGADRVVFGSDWPHAEGLENPASFAKELDGVSDADIHKIMYSNARGLVTPRSA